MNDAFDDTKKLDMALARIHELEGVISGGAQLLPMSVIDALRDSPCPRPFNGRPDDFKSGACYDSGECGCQNGVALKAAALAAPLQVDEASIANIVSDYYDEDADGRWLKCAKHIADSLCQVERSWMPIETAPKDGTTVDLWQGVRLPDCRWESSFYHTNVPWGWMNSTYGRITGATHWRPLPTPPVIKGNREGGAA